MEPGGKGKVVKSMEHTRLSTNEWGLGVILEEKLSEVMVDLFQLTNGEGVNFFYCFMGPWR